MNSTANIGKAEDLWTALEGVMEGDLLGRFETFMAPVECNRGTRAGVPFLWLLYRTATRLQPLCPVVFAAPLRR